MRVAIMRAVSALALAAACAVSGPAFADSFALNENSALELGRANAGATTQTGDASAAFGNPALMSLFEQPTFTAALSGVFGSGESFTDTGSTDLLGAPLGPGADNFLDDAAIPALHVVYPIDRRWAAGLSVSVPFGLSTSYDPNWAGRYQAIDSELKTVNINPSVSYRVNDTVSVGLGISAQYIDATLTNAIDFGAVCLGALPPATCVGLGLTPQAADGRVSVKGDDWTYGYNVGVAWAPSQNWLLGLAYRSEIDHTLRGDANFDVPAQAAPLTAGGAFIDSPASAEADLPATLEAGVRWRASERATLYLDARWRYWSSLQELRVKFANPAQPDAVIPLHYEDSGRVSVGLDYAVSDHWTLRGGLAYDETPTQDEFRSARISDDNRMYYALGASFTGWEGWQVDLAYNRVEIDDHNFDHVGSFGDHLVGRYEGAADVVSIGVTRRLGRGG
jgi:long-chain fatty acid transport protein